MKAVFLTTIVMLLLSYAKSQPVIGMGGGYSTAKSPVFSLQAGYKAGNSLLYYNQLIQHKPQILGLRYGYNLGSFQPNAGLDYHLLPGDKSKAYKPGEGFHFAFGLTKYFESMPLKIDLGVSGKYVIAHAGIYKIFD